MVRSGMQLPYQSQSSQKLSGSQFESFEQTRLHPADSPGWYVHATPQEPWLTSRLVVPIAHPQSACAVQGALQIAPIQQNPPASSVHWVSLVQELPTGPVLGATTWRGPQSAQSVPSSQTEYADPSPPSSQVPSPAH